MPYWHSVCDGSHVLFVLGQHFRIVVIVRLGISATIAIDPLFEIIRPKVAINSCRSSVPSPHHHGRGPYKCIFFWRSIANHIPEEGFLSSPPLGSPQGDGLPLKEDDDMTNLLSPGVKFLPNLVTRIDQNLQKTVLGQLSLSTLQVDTAWCTFARGCMWASFQMSRSVETLHQRLSEYSFSNMCGHTEHPDWQYS